MSYFRFPHISELSFTGGRRRRVFWPSPLNHPHRSESFIIVTIISISLTHKSCHKSTHISFFDNMHDQCRKVPQLQLLLAVWLQFFFTVEVFYESASLQAQHKNSIYYEIQIFIRYLHVLNENTNP